MQTLVIYDVADVTLRNRVIDVLEDYGLERIQYSAFLGDLSYNRREEMCQRLEDTVADGAARLHVVTLCDRDYRSVREIIGRLSWQMEVTSRTIAPRRARAKGSGGRVRRGAEVSARVESEPDESATAKERELTSHG